MARFSEFTGFQRVPATRKTYRLTRDLVWHVGSQWSDWPLVVPAGTHFDVSVPQLLAWVLSPHDRRVLPAAAVHDELLKLGFDPAFASAEFRRAALARGTCPTWSWVYFAATLLWTT